MRRFDVRLTAPLYPGEAVSRRGCIPARLYPGETVRSELCVDGDVISLRASVLERGVKVLDNGRAELLPAG